MDITEPRFTNTEVLEVTGLDAATLQTWANRRFVVPASEEPSLASGRGGKRRYSVEDVLWLSILKHAVDLRLPIGMAAGICDANTVRSELRRYGSLPWAFVVTFLAAPLRSDGRPVDGGHLYTAKIRSAEEIASGFHADMSTDEFVAQMARTEICVLVVPARAIEIKARERLDLIFQQRRLLNGTEKPIGATKRTVLNVMREVVCVEDGR